MQVSVNKFAIATTVAFVTLVSNTAAWSQTLGCGTGGDPETNILPQWTAIVDGNATCGNVQGLFGCAVKSIGDSCEIKDSDGNVLFTVDTFQGSKKNATSWTVTPNQQGQSAGVGIDFVSTGGAEAGGACGFFLPYDAASGVDYGFIKSFSNNGTPTYQVPSEISFCTDGLAKSAPEPIVDPVIGYCPDITDSTINDVQVACPPVPEGGDSRRINISIAPDETGVVIEACTCGKNPDGSNYVLNECDPTIVVPFIEDPDNPNSGNLIPDPNFVIPENACIKYLEDGLQSLVHEIKIYQTPACITFKQNGRWITKC